MLIKKFKKDHPSWEPKVSQIKNVSRLKRVAQFFNGFMRSSDFIEVYINPTSAEIIKAYSAGGHSVRGLIYDDSTEYCWPGYIFHDSFNNYAGKSDFNLDINQFRFAYEGNGGWIIDLHKKWTFKEGMDLILKYQNVLSKYGDLNKEITLFYASDNVKDIITKDELTTSDLNNIILGDSNAIGYDDGINSINGLLNYLNTKNANANPENLEQSAQKRLLHKIV